MFLRFSFPNISRDRIETDGESVLLGFYNSLGSATSKEALLSVSAILFHDKATLRIVSFCIVSYIGDEIICRVFNHRCMISSYC